MNFYRKNKNNDNCREQHFPEKKKTRFQVSDKSFRSATIVSSFAITIFTFISFIIKTDLAISESDIQSISGITAGLCGFALAIPLFLKDFDITSNFWKQFYFVAITFLLASFVGTISFLLIDDSHSISITLYLWFFSSIAISVNINNIGNLLNKIRFKFRFSINPTFNLTVSYFVLFISLIFPNGYFWIYATVLFSIFGFYLTLALMLSILIELLFTTSKMEDNDSRIKKSIQRLVEKHIDEALSEQILIDKLRTEEFANEQEIISRTRVLELVTEMDSETADNEPKITIYENIKIIPRWRKEYDEIFSKTNILIFIKDEKIYYSKYDSLKVEEKDIDDIYKVLANKTNLSEELLKENNCISKYYLLKGERTFDKQDYANECDILRCLFIVKDADFIEVGTTINLTNLYEGEILYLNNDFEVKNYANYSMSIIWKRNLNEIF